MVSTPESDRHRGLHRRAKARRPSDDAPAERDLIVADDENVFANKKRGSNFRFRVYSDPEDSATWSEGTSGWTLHLGCGGLEPYPSFTAGQNTKYTVAPGKYEFDGSGTTPLVLTANEWPEVTTCVGLYVIAHFCSVE